MKAKSNILFLLFLLLNYSGYSYHLDSTARWTANFGGGIPVTFFSAKSSPIAIYSAGTRYSLSPILSLGLNVNFATFQNSHIGNPYQSVLIGTSSDISSFRTENISANFSLYLNLLQTFSSLKNKPTKISPYLHFGFGYNFSKPSVVFVNGDFYKSQNFVKPFRDFQIGIGNRHYLNYLLDFSYGVDYHYAQTYYLDGLKESSKPKLDTYLNFYTGVSLKIGASKTKNLSDWKSLNKPATDSINKYNKASLDISFGIPTLLTPIGTDLTGMAGLGLRYSFTPFLSSQVVLNYGKVKGNQLADPLALAGTPSSIESFETNLFQYSGRLLFNIFYLNELPQDIRKWNHYLVVGGGFTVANGSVVYANGQSFENIKLFKNLGVYTYVFGFQSKYFLNQSVDLNIGLDFNYNQSKWLDNAYIKPTFNHNLYLFGGVSYKFIRINQNSSVFIDWANQKNKTKQSKNLNDTEDSISTNKSLALIAGYGSSSFGLELSKSLGQSFGLRIGYYSGNLVGQYYAQYNGNSILVNGKIDISMFNFFVDYYLFKYSSFRAVAGLSINNNEYQTILSSSNAQKIGFIYFDPKRLGNVILMAKGNEVSPYLGIGFGRNVPKYRFGLGIDLGLFYQGKPQFTVLGNGSFKPSGTNGNEVILENAFRKFVVYPHLNMSIRYRIIKR